MCVCVCVEGGGGRGGSPSPCAGPELAGSSSTVFAVNLIFYLRGWLRLLGAGERGAVCSLSHLSSSLAFIFTRSFLLRTAPHYLNAWNRLHGRLLWGKTWSRGTNSGVNVTHKKWWIKWHKIIWKNREIDHQIYEKCRGKNEKWRKQNRYSVHMHALTAKRQNYFSHRTSSAHFRHCRDVFFSVWCFIEKRISLSHWVLKILILLSGKLSMCVWVIGFIREQKN